MLDSSTRRSGRTTRQLAAAPRDTIYVAPGRYSIAYVRGLAVQLGRGDIIVVVPSVFSSPEKFFGFAVLPPLVLDHAARLTGYEWVGVRVYQERRQYLQGRYSAAEYQQRAAQAAAALRRNLR